MIWIKFILVLILTACHKQGSDPNVKEPEPDDLSSAVVLSVDVSGSQNNYTFNVEIESPDKGCDQYADWWEVVSLDTILIYRRILTHSHVDEQPFKRSGGPVPIGELDQIYIRAHMNNLGYGTQVLSGSVASGFSPVMIDTSFGRDLLFQAPLPDGCAF